uniref:Uncharacterized protein n=1 Tax=Fagus sylvatica TaxID=28930 RepID=A0A2N9HP60_FAGSY
MTGGDLNWVVWPLTTPRRAPSSTILSSSTSPSPFLCRLLLLLAGAFEGLKAPVSLSFFLTKLGFPCRQARSLVAVDVLSTVGLGSLFHSEIFSSTPLWG